MIDWTKKRVMIGSLGVLVLSGWGAWQLLGSGSTTTGGAPAAAERSKEFAARNHAGRHGDTQTTDDAALKRGLQYAVEYDILLDSGDDAGNEARLAGSGKLNLLEIGPDEKGVRWVGFVSEAGGAADLPGATTRVADGLAAEMQTPFTFVVSPKGNVEGIGFRDEEKLRGQSILRAVVAALQFVGGETGTRTWTTEETDSTGRCSVRYEKVSTDHFNKTKTECPFLLATSSSALKMKGDVASKATYALDGQRIVLEVATDETLTLKFPQGGQASTGAKLNLLLVGRTDASNPHLNYREWSLGPLYGAVRKPRDLTPAERVQAKKDLLAGATYADLSNGLDAAIENQDPSARNREFARLSTLFDLEPESIEAAAKQLRDDIDTSKAEAIVAALADSRSPAAQEEMNAIVHDPNVEDHVKGHVVTHMGLHDAPSVETFETLADVAAHGEDPMMRDSATLALGGAVRHGQASEETREVATRTTAELEKAYDEAPTPEERSLVMAALGNAGAESSLSPIDKALRSEDPHARADAVFSLRFVVGEAAEQRIAAVLTSDPIAEVRRAAAETFGYRDMTEILEAAALHAYQKDESAAVRTAVVSFLSASMPNVGPKGRATLELATRDEDSEVATIATAALGPDDPSAPSGTR